MDTFRECYSSKRAATDSSIAISIAFSAFLRIFRTAGAIKVKDNCAVIEESICLSCGMCAVKCPRHVIHDLHGILTEIR